MTDSDNTPWNDYQTPQAAPVASSASTPWADYAPTKASAAPAALAPGQLPAVSVTPTADDYRNAGLSVPANLRTEDETAFQKFNDFGNDVGDAVAHHLANPLVGAAQLLGHGLSGAADTLLPADSSVRQALDNNTQNFDANARAREQKYQQNVPTNVASTIGAGIGETIPWLIGGGALRATGALPQATTALGKIGVGALEGGAIGASQPVLGNGSFVGNKASQIGLGAGTGSVIPAIGAIPSAIIGQVDPVAQQLAKKAEGFGIDLTAPQLSNSTPMKIINSVTSKVPLSGAQAFADKQAAQFNNAVAQTIGLPSGTMKITPDVFAAAKDQASQGFNDLWSRNNMQLTPQILQKAVSVANDAAKLGGADSGSAVNEILDRIADQGSSGVLPGRAFQSIDSQLGKIAGNGGEKGYYAGQLQDVLRDGMQQSMSPQDASQLQQLRGIWQNLKTITPMMSKVTDGNVPPAQLMGAVTSNGSGKAAMATGNRGDLGDLAQIGQRFLKNQVPDSGTAQRVMYQNALMGAGGLGGVGAFATVNPVAALTTAASAGAGIGISRATQALLRSRMLYNALANQAPKSTATYTNALRSLPAITAENAVQQNALNAPQNSLALPSPQYQTMGNP